MRMRHPPAPEPRPPRPLPGPVLPGNPGGNPPPTEDNRAKSKIPDQGACSHSRAGHLGSGAGSIHDASTLVIFASDVGPCQLHPSSSSGIRRSGSAGRAARAGLPESIRPDLLGNRLRLAFRVAKLRVRLPLNRATRATIALPESDRPDSRDKPGLGISRFWRCVRGVWGRLGGWRSGWLCATRVRLICAGLGGRRTMVRRGEPLSRHRAWPGRAGCS